jgi:VanZ family protein
MFAVIARRGALGAFWALFGLICFWTLAPVGFRPQTGHAALERFAAFLALGGALGLSYPRRWLVVAAAICAIALGTEALQLVMPSRAAQLIDAVEKSLGGLAGVAGSIVLDWCLAGFIRESTLRP